MKKRENRVKYYVAALLSLITFLVYLPALQNEFVLWDDNRYIYENPHIRSFNLDFFRWAFFDFYAANWHPLTWISHAVDYAVWGLNAWGHHLTSIILHGANTFLVVVTVIKLFEMLKRRATDDGQLADRLSDRSVFLTAGVTGLLFGLHPLHVESVAWVSERKDLLCALFFLLSIITYIKYAGVICDGMLPHNFSSRFFDRRYLLTAGFFVLALLSKPMAVSLPFVLLVLDWFPFRRISSWKTFGDAFVEKLPFLSLSLFSSVVTVFAQKSSNALAPIKEIGLSTRVLVAAKSIIVYLWKMILPLNLIPLYPYQKNISVISPQYLLALIGVIGITITCMAMIKKSKLWLAVWIYYIVTLIPVLGIVQVGNQSMADRYTYLPSLGPFIVFGLALVWVLERIDSPTRRRMILKTISMTIVLSAFICMSYLTFKQIAIWRSSMDLWNYVIKKEPETARAYAIRGIVFDDRGQLDRAIEDYTKALALEPWTCLSGNWSQ
jgi:hypothetical protein